MLTVLIETGNDAEALARTLASLVGGAVEGVVREVIVLDSASIDGTREVAEHAGCEVCAAGEAAAAIVRAKGDWLLLLRPGARLADGWIEPVLAHARSSVEPARFTPAGAGPAEWLRLLSRRDRAFRCGLLVRKAAGLARAPKSLEEIAAGLRARRLDAKIIPAGG